MSLNEPLNKFINYLFLNIINFLFIYSDFSIKPFYSYANMNKSILPLFLLFRRRKVNALLTLFCLMLLAGCQDNTPVSETGERFPQIVDLTIATKVAESYVVIENPKQAQANGKQAAPATKKVKDRVTVSEKESPAFYVFNYEGGGFLVLSVQVCQAHVCAARNRWC